MRVGVIGPVEPDSFADNIVHSLSQLGVTPVPLGPMGPDLTSTILNRTMFAIRGLSAEFEEVAQRSLLRRSRDSQCDVIINVQSWAMPSTIRALKATGAWVCLWFPDAVSNLGRLALVESEYDALFLTDPLLAARLQGVYGMRAHYLPEACNPTWHRPMGQVGIDSHIAVVGSHYPTRIRLLKRLHASGVPLKLYGSGFPRWSDPGPLAALHTGTFLRREAKSQVFRQARGVLNNLHPAEMQSVNCRLFEAAAAGGAVLCERRQSLDALFTEGDEVLPFGSYDELLEHCERLLSDDSLVKRIGDAASARALRDHAYAVRLEQVLEVAANT